MTLDWISGNSREPAQEGHNPGSRKPCLAKIRSKVCHQRLRCSRTERSPGSRSDLFRVEQANHLVCAGAELAVLNACNSGAIGAVKRGGGMSPSYAFVRTGAPNSVSTVLCLSNPPGKQSYVSQTSLGAQTRKAPKNLTSKPEMFLHFLAYHCEVSNRQPGRDLCRYLQLLVRTPRTERSLNLGIWPGCLNRSPRLKPGRSSSARSTLHGVLSPEAHGMGGAPHNGNQRMGPEAVKPCNSQERDAYALQGTTLRSGG